jgi:hypothetical protein
MRKATPSPNSESGESDERANDNRSDERANDEVDERLNDESHEGKAVNKNESKLV